MNIQIETNSSTNSLGKTGFMTTTAAVFAWSGFTSIPQGYHTLNEITPESQLVASADLKPTYQWEALLHGSESSGSGGQNLYISDSSNFSQLYSFALSLLQEQTDMPFEFHKVFKENFWDILA